jgi:hypothetical protein
MLFEIETPYLAGLGAAFIAYVVVAQVEARLPAQASS